MCNNNGHCRKFDAGTMCPSYRVDARRGAPDARPREHAAARAVRPARRRTLASRRGARGARPLRELQGLPARMPDRRRHGEDEDRVRCTSWQRVHGLPLRSGSIAHLPRWAPWAARCRGSRTCATRCPGAARLSEALARVLGAAHRCRVARATRSCATPRRARGDAGSDADVVLFVDTFTNYFEPENAHAALRVLRAAGYRVAVARPTAAIASPRGRCAAAARTSPRAWSTRRSAKRGACVAALRAARRARRRDRRPRAVVPAVAARRIPGDGPRRGRAAPRASSAFLIEEFLAREHAPGGLRCRLRALPQKRALLHGHCHQKAFDARGADADACWRWCPDLAVERRSNRAAAAWPAASATTPRTTTCRCAWPSFRCCRPCAPRRRTR